MPISLIQKLDSFKFELADSLSIESKQISLIDLLVNESSKRENILINFIEFDSLEIESLIDCFSHENNTITDSNYIRIQAYSNYSGDINFYTLSKSNKEEEYVTLFWLYHLIDKSYISNRIIMKNDKEVYLNGELLGSVSEIREKLILSNTNIKDFSKRSVISITGDKDSVSIDLVDKIENELYEADALRINYSTLP